MNPSSVSATTTAREGGATDASTRTDLPTKTDSAYDRLEERIVTLRLEPGSAHSEQDLAAQVGLGRTPVREALQRLEADRLVRIVPRVGIRITEIDGLAYLDALDTRTVLDELLAGQAARRATPQDRSELSQCAALMQQAVAADDTEQFMALDRQCDEALGRAARNPFAMDAVRPLHAHSRRFWFRHRHADDALESAVLHAAMLLAVADGNEGAAERASRDLSDYLDAFTRRALDF